MPARCGLQGRVIRSTVGGGGPTDSLHISTGSKSINTINLARSAPKKWSILEQQPRLETSLSVSATGQILEVVEGVTNLGNGRTEGLEFGFTYSSKEYNWGKIDLQFDGSYLYYLTQQTLQGVKCKRDPLYCVFK